MSWAQLKAMLDENRQTQQEAKARPPDACPNCGALLDVHPKGVRNCPMGDYTYRG